MTRERALEIIKEEYAVLTPASILRMFEGLGMLKLDEPKDAVEKFFDVVEGFGTLTRQDGARLASMLGRAGLKIVSK
jgi:hypothetical protein